MSGRTDPRGGPVGFIGVGRMGWPMVKQLTAAEVDLVLHDADVDRAATLAEQVGCRAAPSPAAMAPQCEVVITMLPTGAEVHEVVLDGEQPLVAGMRPDSVLIDMGSSEPRQTRALAERLQPAGVHVIDAPVSGGVARAEQGDLAVLVGGPEAIVERCRPLLDIVARSVIHTGPLGSAHAIKAINNLLSAAGLMIATEGLLIGARFGLDPHVMLEVFNASTGRNNSTEHKLAPFVLSGRYDSGFGLDLMVKDLTNALELAEQTETAAPLAATVLGLAREAREALGSGRDHTEVSRWYQARAGTTIESPGS